MRIAIALLWVTSAFGAWSSIVLPGRMVGSAPLPALESSPIRVEVRIHNRTPIHRPNSGDIVRLAGLTIANFYGNNSVLTCSYAAFIYNLPEDFTVRMQRDPDRKILSCEAWDTLTGKRIGNQSVPMPAVAAAPRTLVVGGPYNDSQLAFLRVFSTLVPLNGPPPQALNQTADIAHYEFDGDSRDSSGNGRHLTWTGGNESYAATAVHPPVCLAGDLRVFKTGEPVMLDASHSYSLDGSGSLTYEWQSSVTPGKANLQFSSRADPVSTITGTVFGSYDFELKVADQAGVSSVCKVKYGVVEADEHGVVKLPDETEEDKQRNILLGPLMAYGRNPWPWADERHKGMADYFGGKLEKEWIDHWNIALPGTISVVKGSPIVTGTGTSFRNEFCGGGETPKTYHYLYVWYPLPGGGYGRIGHGIKACNSDEQLTLIYPYTRSASASELNYSNDRGRYGAWIGNETNANFYDNVLAYYSLYYRTGIDTYLQYAQTLADRWWSMPWIDEGRACPDQVVCLAPRNQALTGLTIRALERGDMWPGMRRLWDYYRPLVRSSSYIGDIRERGYELMFVAQCALVDPDLEHRKACAADVNEAINNRWARQQRPDKSWIVAQFYAGPSTWSDTFGIAGGGTISVENGSTRVVGTGTKWQESLFKNAYFWVCNHISDGDPVAYWQPKFISETEIELPRPYEGPTATEKKWQSAILVGAGTQPFMMGIVATALNYAYRATGNPLARQLAIDAAYWIKDYGYQPATKGLYYARTYPNCEPISDGLPGCSYPAAAPQSSRFLNGEVFNALAQAYMYTRDESLKTRADELYGAVFGNPASGGLTSDRFYVSELGDNGWSITASKAKDFGFFFGMGFSAGWPAARLVEVSERAQNSILAGTVPDPGRN